ncbi:FtsK/SpoIIIE domain-containing protein [Streptomyces beijiangensis]|uniref:FHA domain-containing protein n=1 Tax=Streptomyces beijiangensis TaxID=163361 RepID=A0A939JK71_9ACTN|nr:FtsK/SpoIIIE domain-containing protein [Streptomyces beijiangensis]MBO0515507.1 FHA domain-containing protein [Streptomyces beijiangensis]
MQIRLTVLAPRSGRPSTEMRSCDVLVTAPAGTALAAVASGLATAAAGPDAGGSGAVVLYAGHRRLDVQRCALGEPPLVDGAVLSLQVPAEDDEWGLPWSNGVESLGNGAHADEGAAQLHVVSGPDAGGVHLLHGGQIRIGRSADADVPLDDPDVSRLHCAITVGEDGRVTVGDLGSTNGTSLDGVAIGGRPVRLAPGALLRIGESALRLASASGDARGAAEVVPDGEGHLRVTHPGADPVDGGANSRPGGEDSAYGTNPGGAGGAGGAGVLGATTGSSDVIQGRPVGDFGSGSVTVHPRDGRGRRETPPRGTRMPLRDDDIDEHSKAEAEGEFECEGEGDTVRRRGGLGSWARRFTGGRGEAVRERVPAQAAPVAGDGRPAVRAPESWPDPAALLLTALGPGTRLWERGPGHPEALVVRLGTADRAEMASVPVTVSLREAGSLGLAGPRERLAGLARAAVAQLAALHSPADLEIVLISTDRGRSLADRKADWGWLGWLPHLRPAHGQDCRLLLAYDREQAAARTEELVRRLDYGPLGTAWASADARSIDEAARNYEGPRTVVVVDGDPGSSVLRETTARLAAAGAAAGIHLLCLAETPAASALSPVDATYESACAASLAFRECGAVALLSGDVATALRLLRTAGGQPAGHGTLAALDAVSAAWAERFGRALAPLRADTSGEPSARQAAALPRSARLLDELGLARATPASLMARWASAADGKDPVVGSDELHRPPGRGGPPGSGGGSAAPGARALAVLGAGPRGPLTVDLAAEGTHLLIEGPAGSGRTELIRATAASLAAAARPDRLALILVDGSGGDGLFPCTELPHTSTHLVASDPVRMREFAQSLGAELKRRAELLGSIGFAEWHTQREVSERMVGQRTAPGTPGGRRVGGTAQGAARSEAAEQFRPTDTAPRVGPQGRPGDIESADSGTLRLRGRVVRTDQAADGASPLPRIVVLVDDFDALVAPALGSPGRPAAGSVVRALEAVAREGERLGVHLIAASARPDRTADTELAHIARLRVVLDPAPVAPGPEDPSPGRGRLGHPDGRVTPFQGGRVTGRIPRTATSRPTVVPLEWERMGDPPTRRPVRELGNGPTDLALLASALDRAARSVDAVPIPPLGDRRDG